MSYTGGELHKLFDPDHARHAVRSMADTGGDWLFERIVANTPVSYHGRMLEVLGESNRVPGTLKARWKRMPAQPAGDLLHGGWEVQVQNDDPIAPYVEYDTKPHLIKPKKPGGRLRFRLWPTGELVYARVVKHPGTKGHYMVHLAVHAATLNFHHILDRPLHEWAEEAAAKVHA